MYFTTYEPPRIWRVGLDGKNLKAICGDTAGLGDIAMDRANNRIFWADFEDNKIKSCNLDGQHVTTLITCRKNSGPRGILTLNGRIYWTNTGGSKNLQSCDIFGQDLRTHYSASDR